MLLTEEMGHLVPCFPFYFHHVATQLPAHWETNLPQCGKDLMKPCKIHRFWMFVLCTSLTHTGLLHCIWQPAQQRLSPPRHSKHGFRHSSTARTCMRSVEVSGVYCKKLGTPLAAANLINYTEGGWSGSVQQVGPGPALGAGLWPRTEVPLGTSPVYCPAHRWHRGHRTEVP